MPSSRANWRRRISRMSSAWMSVSLNCLISAGFGSSDSRMVLITFSIFRKTVLRPSRMWMRRSTCPRRNLTRRVTVETRNSAHSPSMSRMFLRPGRPSSPSTTRLIEKFSSRLVCASINCMNSSGSWRDERGSSTRRTLLSLSDSSFTLSSAPRISCFKLVCVGVTLPFLSLGLGLVMTSSSVLIRCAEVVGGSS